MVLFRLDTISREGRNLFQLYMERSNIQKQTKVVVKTQSKAMRKRSEPTDQKALLKARTSAVKEKRAKSDI